MSLLCEIKFRTYRLYQILHDRDDGSNNQRLQLRKLQMDDEPCSMFTPITDLSPPIPCGPMCNALIPSSSNCSIYAAFSFSALEGYRAHQCFLDMVAAVSIDVAIPTPTNNGGQAFKPTCHQV